MAGKLYDPIDLNSCNHCSTISNRHSKIILFHVSSSKALYEMPLVKNKSIKIPHASSSLSAGTSLLDRFDFLSSNGLTLLSSLLQYDYKQRWSAAQALQCPYFEENPLPSRSENMPVFPTK